jgi:HSP20 family protein
MMIVTPSSGIISNEMETTISNKCNENEICKSMQDHAKSSWSDWQGLFSPTSWNSGDWQFKTPQIQFPSMHASNWKPADWNFHTPMNIKETEKTYEVCIDFPGMKKEDISVSVKANAMIINAERKPVETKEGEKFHQMEIPSGNTSRSFHLPANAQKNDVKATYVNGVLHLTIPKSDDSFQDEVRVDVV